MDYQRLQEIDELFRGRWEAFTLAALAEGNGSLRYRELLRAMRTSTGNNLDDNAITRVTKRLIAAGMITQSRSWNLHSTYTLTAKGRYAASRLEALVQALAADDGQLPAASTERLIQEVHHRRARDAHPPRPKKDAVADARALVLDLYPDARWALVAGSVITPHRTNGSDLDIVVVLADGDDRAPHRDSCHYRGWPVELFVHDERTLTYYIDKDLATRRPIMLRMVATGAVLLGDSDGWQDRCAIALAAGPPHLTTAERDHARYALTDLLDDLQHAEDPHERTAVAAAAWTAVAEHALALAQHWTGSGKWLLRELRDLDPALADEWVTAHGDREATGRLIRHVLDGHGGPLFDGHRVNGERPDS